MAAHANTVSPFPNPSAAYMGGAKRGMPNAASERTNNTTEYAAYTPGRQQKLTASMTAGAIRTGSSVQRERVDDIHRDSLERESEATADKEDANVGHDPGNVRARSPACDEQPSGKEECPWDHGSYNTCQ